MKYEKFMNLCNKALIDYYKINKEQFTINAIWFDEDCERANFLDMENNCVYMCHHSKSTGDRIFVAKFKMNDKLIIRMER